MNKKPITAPGAKKLREELQRLKAVERPNIIKAIAEARAHGDLSENAEYHAAREQQGFIEGRINALEATLSNAQIIDVKSLNISDQIVFGATVELLNLMTDKTVCYQIVGEEEANIECQLISIVSPIARALIGKTIGEEITVQAPGGACNYEIIDIRYE